MKIAMSKEPTSENLEEIRAIDNEINELEKREEVFWAQRSRQDWLREGDKNTSFFHKKAEQRRQRNTIKDVLDGGVPLNASYTWRFVISAKDLVVKGSCWLIGNWRNVQLWGDKWVPSLSGSRVSSLPTHPDLYVQDAITKKRILNYEQEDILQWKHTKNGEFNVRSAYHFELEREFGGDRCSSSTSKSKLWNNIWNSNVPQKVKHLVWRAVANGIPTMETLASRGLEVDRICPRCGKGDETTLTYSSSVWRAVQSSSKLGNCNDVCLANLENEESMGFLEEKDRSSGCLDEVGDIMMSASMGISLKCSPLEAEAQAILFGITLAYDAGLRRLEVESGCLHLVKMLQGSIKEKLAAQFIVCDILNLTSIFDFCSFDFCPRKCNNATPLIAKSFLDHNELRVLMEDCILDVWPVILGDKNLI
uniref:RNase H type-1 domain-containing protein n=1 Tax=Chenopodium quinoa TaxID=63459 RepID=A0A803LLZ1_CHEQI